MPRVGRALWRATSDSLPVGRRSTGEAASLRRRRAEKARHSVPRRALVASIPDGGWARYPKHGPASHPSAQCRETGANCETKATPRRLTSRLIVRAECPTSSLGTGSVYLRSIGRALGVKKNEREHKMIDNRTEVLYTDSRCWSTGSPMAPRSPIESQLVEWASVNLPAAVSAIQRLPHDQAWRARCVAAIVRARADADIGWLFAVVEGPHWEYVVSLPVGRVCGYPVRGTFAQWVQDIRAMAGVSAPVQSDDVVVIEKPVPPAPVAIPEKRKDAILFAA